jgi:hypothetical protein
MKDKQAYRAYFGRMGCRNFLFAIFSLSIACNIAYAGYWFQFGVRAGNSGEFNQGASVSIQTIAPQNVSTGAPAFWVGDDLENSAFLQIGYLVVNETGSYPSYCDIGQGCTSYEDIGAGQAEWFYEYFPSGYSGSAFLGAVGPAGSAGVNGTFNNYGFYYSNGRWDFIFNGNNVGSVNLNASNSGAHTPVAFGELANASNGKAIIRPVIMQNLSMYSDGAFTPLATGYSYVGYGSGSQEDIPVPYGVAELNNRVDYFEVGSNVTKPADGSQLWSLGYNLNIRSKYGNLTGTTKDIAYSRIMISAPQTVYLGNGTRVEFSGWEGTGIGSYSGNSNATEVSMNGNITEVAQWKTQYLVTILSDHGRVNGTGWYAPNSTVAYGINSTLVYGNSSSRYLFGGWSIGANQSKSTIRATSPLVIKANWQPQYLVNATAQYGNVSGAGWFPANTTDTLSVGPQYVQINSTSRYGFYSWSNGQTNRSLVILINRPYSLYGSFRKQYRYSIQAVDEAGDSIYAGNLYANGQEINNTPYLFGGQAYNITTAYYKGVWMPVNRTIEVSSSAESQITLPVYNVEVLTKDIFGMPINATLKLRFTNATIINTSTGSGGEFIVYDAPYGSATVVAKYFILTSDAKAANGLPVNLLLITPFDLLVFVPVIIIAVLVYLYSSRVLGRPGPGARQDTKAETTKDGR